MGPNPRRELLIEFLADPTDRRSKTEKSKAAGFTERYIFRLQRDPTFRKAVIDKMREHVGANLPQVYARLFAIARDGIDRDAIKACDALLRASGDIATASQQIVNVNQTSSEETYLERLRALRERIDNQPTEPLPARWLEKPR